jgi:hypothetical protein
MLEADSLQHSFAAEELITLQEYIDQKLALYNKAGELDEDAMTQRLMLGADPALAKLVDMDRYHTSVDDIKAQLTVREWAARKDWKKQNEASA